MPTKFTNVIIAAAIEGFEAQKARLDGQIQELRAMLSGGPAEPAATSEVPNTRRRKFSAATRKRMKEAQQRRWAKIHGESEPPASANAEAPKPKRRISKEGMARIIAATKKRWAAVHKAEKSAPSKAPAKKKLSPARKAALLANLAKARAARAAKRAAA